MNMETKNFIETCDFINMDTSALMETDSLLNFLENYGSIILKAGRTIFVCREVIAELKLLLQCDKPLKVHQAETALSILYDNFDLFRLEAEPDSVDVRIVHKRIADQRIISAVTWYKVQHTQLFISNDKALLRAIVTADQMDAVHGKPVYATRLSKDGELIEQTSAEELANKRKDYLAVKVQDAEKAAHLLSKELHIPAMEVVSSREIHLPGFQDTAAVNRILYSNNYNVEEVFLHQQDLEEYFIELMGGTDHE